MILDLTADSMIDVTVGLALENAIKDALDAKCEVILLCEHAQARQRLEKLNILQLISSNSRLEKNEFESRGEALQAALNHVENRKS
jgi:SulP family sulfate permease